MTKFMNNLTDKDIAKIRKDIMKNIRTYDEAFDTNLGVKLALEYIRKRYELIPKGMDPINQTDCDNV